MINRLNNHNNDYSSLDSIFKEKYGFSINLDPFHPPVWLKNDVVPTISIVIPAYNVSESIKPCLLSIEKSSFNQKFPQKLEVIVVDDGSKDDTWKKLKSVRPNLNYIWLQQNNNGQAQALNTGISQAQNDIIISCDSDMVLSYFTIEHMALRHANFKNILIAGYRYDIPGSDKRVNPQHIKNNGIYKFPTFINDERLVFPQYGVPSSMALITNHYKNFKDGKKLRMPNQGDWLLPDLVFGALFSLSRDVFEEIGGYDERLKGWGCTDGFLAAKAVASGNYVVPVYSASGFHIHHEDRSEKKLNEFKENRKKFFKISNTTQIDQHVNWIKKARVRINQKLKNSHKSKIVQEVYIDDQLNDYPYFMFDSYLALGKVLEATQYLPHEKEESSKFGYLFRRGKLAFAQGNYEEAIAYYNKAISLDSTHTEVVVEKIKCLSLFRNFEEAKNILNSIQNDESFGYWNIDINLKISSAKQYILYDDHKTALDVLLSALVKEPNNKEVLSLISQLGISNNKKK